MNSKNIVVDFTLKDQHNKEFNLFSELKKGMVLLSFHPLAWTKVCAEQMKSLEVNFERFGSLNVVPVGISVDSVPCKHAWMKSLGIKKLRVLSDFWPHGGVAESIGILREEGFSERANYLIGKDGEILFRKIYPISEVPDIEELVKVIEQIREV